MAEPVRSVRSNTPYAGGRGCAGLLLAALAMIFLPASAKSQALDSNTQNRADLRAKPNAHANGAAQKDQYADAREPSAREYRIGTDDVVEITVFEASELNGKLRVSANGEISMPLLGTVPCGGLTAAEFESELRERLHAYMKDPHVGVFVITVESHPISVLGAVKKPGVFQVRGPKTVLEMLSMAEGITDDAGESVLVMRGAGAPLRGDANDTKGSTANLRAAERENGAPSGTKEAEEGSGTSERAGTTKINLNQLLKSEDPEINAEVYPGDVVKVVKADVIYVVGEVKRPGGFILKNDQRMSVLKAIALAEGLTSTSAKSAARILRTDVHGGQREEIPINLGKILAGKAPDPTLLAADIVFIPNSSSKSIAYRGSEAAVSALTSLLIFRW